MNVKVNTVPAGPIWECRIILSPVMLTDKDRTPIKGGDLIAGGTYEFNSETGVITRAKRKRRSIGA